MPTYLYRCHACGQDFERILSMREVDDAPPPRCPACKSEEVERVFSPFYAVTAKKS